MDFTLDDEDRDKTVVSHVQLMDTVKNVVFYDKLTFVYLQMPNFNKEENELVDHFDKWLYVFKNLQGLHNRPRRLQERVFEKLFSIAEIAKFTPEEVQEYEESLMVYRDLKNSIDTAREEGREEGEVIGEERGIKKGERGKAYNSAEIMMSNGESDEKIVLYTGLTLEQVILGDGVAFIALTHIFNYKLMPRKKRLINVGEVHHVMSRGIDGMVLFRDDEDREKMCSLFGKVFIEGTCQCYAWVLMDNNCHRIYESITNRGTVVIGTSCDTAEFPVYSIWGIWGVKIFQFRWMCSHVYLVGM